MSRPKPITTTSITDSEAAAAALPAVCVLVDVETTGARPAFDRLTEIALIRVEHGVETGRFTSLLNPGMPIPPLIVDLVGITDAMVRDAPDFADIADTLLAWFDGAVFVAHNASFDYGFLRQAFARCGREFSAQVLCTVRLSRALYPDFHRHGLDALIERHGFTCSARHRALGDAEVLQQFLAQASAEFPAEVLRPAVERAMRAPARSVQLAEGVLEGVPGAPGVLVLLGADDAVLTAEACANLRAHAFATFAPGRERGNSARARLVRSVRMLDWVECAGELGAALQALELRRQADLEHASVPFGLQVVEAKARGAVLRRVPLAGSDPREWPESLFGPFRARDEALGLLRGLALKYRLCPRRLGLESVTQGPCTAYGTKRCAGACCGRESLVDHDRRLLGALASSRRPVWPWPGQVRIDEATPERLLTQSLWLDEWCVVTPDDPVRRFDFEVYRALQRWLARPDQIECAVPVSAP